jgi:tRNA (cytidine/uridine-2'-O-)-methyltransferase
MPNSDLHVVLVEPEIHWNTGNAGRTCLATGAQLHLVQPLGFRLDDASLRRAGLDYWERVAPVIWPSWGDLERQLPELGQPFFFTAGGTRDLWSVAYPDRTVLIFGRESVGLPSDLLQKYRESLLSIPMVDASTRSLNLSTAVAVGLFEVRRQRREVTAGVPRRP